MCIRDRSSEQGDDPAAPRVHRQSFNHRHHKGAPVSDQLIHVTTNSSTADAPWRVSMQAGHHDVVAAEPEPAGDTGPSPFELYLASLGSCTALTIRVFAERKGRALDSVSVDIF